MARARTMATTMASARGIVALGPRALRRLLGQAALAAALMACLLPAAVLCASGTCVWRKAQATM